MNNSFFSLCAKDSDTNVPRLCFGLIFLICKGSVAGALRGGGVLVCRHGEPCNIAWSAVSRMRPFSNYHFVLNRRSERFENRLVRVFVNTLVFGDDRVELVERGVGLNLHFKFHV